MFVDLTEFSIDKDFKGKFSQGILIDSLSKRSALIMSSVFKNMTSEGSGTGIEAKKIGNLTVSNCTFFNNTGSMGGAMIV